MKISRRGFLKASGGVGVVAATGVPLSVVAATAEQAKTATAPSTGKKEVVTRYVKSTCCHLLDLSE